MFGLLKSLRIVKEEWLRRNAVLLVRLFHKDIWSLREECLKQKASKVKLLLYEAYFGHYGAWIGLGAKFKGIPVFPHGFYGIFISNSAVIGKDVVIFHQVTIGSNTLQDSQGNGAPQIRDGVYIGCGARIIGNLTVGENARIGAGCTVVANVPANSVAIMRGFETIAHIKPLDNRFIVNNYR